MKLLFLSIIALALCHFSLLGQTKKDAFSKTKDAVVKVISSDLPELGFNSNYGSGTGYIVSKDGYIITNHHVIDEAVAISVIITKGNNVDTIPAYTLWSDSEMDMAVLKIDQDNLPFLEFEEKSKIAPGDEVLALGFPGGSKDIKVTWGIISGIPNDSTLNTTAALNSGNSGGPCINLQGKVVGTIYAKKVSISVEGTGFLRSVDYAASSIEKAKENKEEIKNIIGTPNKEAYAELCKAETAFQGINYFVKSQEKMQYLDAALIHIDKAISLDPNYTLAYFFKASYELYYALYNCEENNPEQSSLYASKFKTSLSKARELDNPIGKYDYYNTTINAELEEYVDGNSVDCDEWNDMVRKAKESLDKKDERIEEFDDYIYRGKRPTMLGDAIGAEIAYTDQEKKSNYGFHAGALWTNSLEYYRQYSDILVQREVIKLVSVGAYINSNKFGCGLHFLNSNKKEAAEWALAGHLRYSSVEFDFNVLADPYLAAASPSVAFSFVSDGFYSQTNGYKVGIGYHNLDMRSREFDAKEKLSLIFSLKALSISLGNNPTFSLLAKSIILPGLYFSTGIEFVFHIYSK